MRPDEPNDRRVGAPLIPQRPIIHTPPSHHDDHTRTAATNVVRGQLDRIYNGQTTTPTPQTTPVPVQRSVQATPPDQANPYHRTHQEHAQIQPDQWQQYHSAWQEYYQKYYERYYMGQIHQAQRTLEEKVAQAATSSTAETPMQATNAPEPMDRSEALYDLRSKLLNQLQDSAKKVRKSRHFIPIAAALGVMLLFLFLQYNRVLFANVQAYISPGSIDPANIIINPATDVAVSSEPKLIIPKINVDVPVIYNTTPDYNAQMKAMEGGVAYFGIPGANSRPGQVGNTVLSGHSSNDILDGGNYKFIFARLDRMAKGDTIFVNYEGKRYTYAVTKTEVVKPTEVNKLIYPTDKPILTLITCTPIGTATNRLLVTAEQISPNPNKATAAPSSSSTGEPVDIPGNSPTFVERIFGGGN